MTKAQHRLYSRSRRKNVSLCADTERRHRKEAAMCWICEGMRGLGPDASSEDMVTWAQEHGVDLSLADNGEDFVLRLYPPTVA